MRTIRKREARDSNGSRQRRARHLEESVANELGRAFRRLNRAMSAALRAQGLSAIQGNILITLWARGPTAMGELQRALGLSSSAFTGAIDRMERSALVQRRASPSDRRSTLVEAARWSAPRKRALIEALLDAEDEFLAPLEGAERRALLRIVRKLAVD